MIMAAPYTPWTPPQVWRVADALRTPAARNKPVSWLEQCHQVLADHRIELKMRPSAKPAEYGHPGASPKQLAFVEAFHAHKHRIYAASGANQCGKTVTTAEMCFCKHLRDYAKAGDVYWVIAQTADTIRDIPQQSIWEGLPESMFDGRRWQPRIGFGHISTLDLVLPGDRGRCTVIFKTEEMNLKRFESSRVNGIWWTECTSEDIFDAVLPRLVARNGWMLMDFVPTEYWHKERIRSADKPDIYSAGFAMGENAHNLAHGAIEFARSHMLERIARVRIDGEDGSEFGVVYPQFNPVRHVVKAFRLPPEAKQSLWRCYDYGFRNPSTLLWATILPVGFKFPDDVGGYWNGQEIDHEIILFYREYYRTEQTPKQQAKVIKTLSGRERYRHRVVADGSIFNRTQVVGSKVTSVAKLLADAGVKCKKARGGRTRDDMIAQVAKVQSWFENDKIIFFDTCPNAIREHQMWRYKNSKNEVEARKGDEVFEKQNDHTPDAVRYLLQERLTYHTTQAIVESA